ncbi:hypothetical protein ACFPYI_10985 [Halomarina salina]|uniref:Uncharacterized protein n=1 Tax=Halomarina salina TaxID=1872699 RepID=A0ABD5RMI9_9EURY|nr:hypothetical protein [Halomarina salina]
MSRRNAVSRRHLLLAGAASAAALAGCTSSADDADDYTNVRSDGTLIELEATGVIPTPQQIATDWQASEVGSMGNTAERTFAPPDGDLQGASSVFMWAAVYDNEEYPPVRLDQHRAQVDDADTATIGYGDDASLFTSEGAMLVAYENNVFVELSTDAGESALLEAVAVPTFADL